MSANPWRVVLALDPQKWPELLSGNGPGLVVCQACAGSIACIRQATRCQHMLFTRYQAFRDLMVKAEQFGSDLVEKNVLSLVVFC